MVWLYADVDRGGCLLLTEYLPNNFALRDHVVTDCSRSNSLVTGMKSRCWLTFTQQNISKNSESHNETVRLVWLSDTPQSSQGNGGPGFLLPTRATSSRAPSGPRTEQTVEVGRVLAQLSRTEWHLFLSPLGRGHNNITRNFILNHFFQCETIIIVFLFVIWLIALTINYSDIMHFSVVQLKHVIFTHKRPPVLMQQSVPTLYTSNQSPQSEVNLSIKKKSRHFVLRNIIWLQLTTRHLQSYLIHIWLIILRLWHWSNFIEAKKVSSLALTMLNTLQVTSKVAINNLSFLGSGTAIYFDWNFTMKLGWMVAQPTLLEIATTRAGWQCWAWRCEMLQKFDLWLPNIRSNTTDHHLPGGFKV